MDAVRFLALGLVLLVVAACGDDTDVPSPDAAVDAGLAFPDASDADADAAATEGGTPDAAVADAGPRPVWLLHITDVHLGASSFAEEAMKTTVQYIDPAVAAAATLNTGDTTDHGTTSEWTTYQGIIQGKVAAFPRYLEIVGNHDVKTDDGQPFIVNSQTGKAGGDMYGISHIDSARGRIRMVRTNTVDSSTALNQLLGYVGESQVQALKAEPPPTVPPAHSIVLGHHPLKGPQSLQVLGTLSRMESLLSHFGAEVYLCGHAHLKAMSWSKQTLVVQSPTLGKPEIFAPDPGFAIVALDDSGPSARFFGLTKSSPAVVAWPLVLITTPADADLAGTNPWAKPVAPGHPDLAVRALGFAPGGIQKMEVRIDDGVWTPMTAIDARLFQTRIVAPTVAGKRKLEVRAVSPEGSRTDGISLLVGP